MAYLEISKDRAVVQSPLGDEPMSIGRQPGNSIVINDPDISRRHCVIERSKGSYHIADLNSRNGTVVNGRRVQRTELKAGDVITLGGAIARFLDVPLKPARRRSSRRSVWIWGPAVVALFVAALIVAWAAGLLGGVPSPREMRKRLGITSMSQPPNVPDQSESGFGADASPETDSSQSSSPPSILPSSAPSAGVSSGASQPVLEAATERLWYQRLDRATAEADRLLGRPVAARFIGKPTAGADGRLTWDLPPDGEITATLAPADAERGKILEIMSAEPLLLEVELAGVLRRDRDGSRLVLRVGVVEILRPWGSADATLRPATRDMLGKRIVIDPQYAAAAILSSEN